MACGKAVSMLIDFGPQPPSNRFLKSNEPDSDVHPLILGQCAECGLVQLIDPMPVAMVRSRYAWLTYNEPEGHLDALVERITRLAGVGADTVIAGLTYKDDSTLARFNRGGYSRTFRLDAAEDLDVRDPTAGLESIQEAVSAGKVRDAARRRGRSDIVVVRHVLEHAHDPRAFVYGLTPLLKRGSYIVFEMPDSTKFLDACDYSFLWEEHIAYFTPLTLEAFLMSLGCEVIDLHLFPYALEDSLVAIVRMGSSAQPARTHALSAEVRRGRQFAKRFPEIRARYHYRLSQLREAGKRVVLFGAGHLGTKFVNFFELADYLDCVIDDHPAKQSLAMPGSRLMIRGSSLLEHERIDLCLLTLSPESEKRVLSAKESSRERGCEFRSIFALSDLAMLT